jgi:hypothetical protein
MENRPIFDIPLAPEILLTSFRLNYKEKGFSRRDGLGRDF